jgi:hypothetical protein
VTAEAFLRDMNRFLVSVSYPKLSGIGKELYFQHSRLHADFVEKYAGRGFQGWDEYVERAEAEIKRITYVSEKVQEIYAKSEDGTLTIAYLFDYLRTTDFYELPQERQANVIRSCIHPKWRTNMWWFHCMTRLPQELLSKANHSCVHEVYIAMHCEECTEIVPWICEKLNDYIPIKEGNLEVPIRVRNPVGLGRIYMETAEDYSVYKDFTLNDAIFEKHFNGFLRGVDQSDRRRTQIYELGTIQSYPGDLKKQIVETEEYLNANASAGPTTDRKRRLLALLHRYAERTKEEIQRREATLGSLSRRERIIVEKISNGLHPDSLTDKHDPDEVEQNPDSPTQRFYAEINDSTVIAVNGDVRFLPISSLTLLHTITRPFDASEDTDDLIVLTNDGSYYVSQKDKLEELFTPPTGEIDTCNICYDDTHRTLGCGNGCGARVCWNCFHTWISENQSCILCRRVCIPLGERS